MNTKQVVEYIDSSSLSEDDVIAIFNALKRQKSVIGGKIWTSLEVRVIAYAAVMLKDSKRDEAEEISEKTVKAFTPSSETINRLNWDSSEEFRTLTDDVEKTVLQFLKK